MIFYRKTSSIYYKQIVYPPEIRYKLEEYGLIIIGYGVDAPTRYRWKPERSFSFYGISCMVSGTGEYITPDKTQIRLYPGDAVFSVPECQYDVHGLQNEDPYVEVCIGFCGSLADWYFHSGIFQHGVHTLGWQKLHLIIQHLKTPTIQNILKGLLLLQELILKSNDAELKLQKPSVSRINKLIQLVSQDLSVIWNIEDMADFCNMSVNHFRNSFIIRTGSNPKLYFDRFRMRKAEIMLRTTQYSLNDIANQFGFSSQFHFSRRFKEITGYSPSDCRKERKK
ncbi:MAG TPA: hypothetical protein DE060_09735 [Lentisphaeria bacterium]|nr:hypothetical protein [Lentisphaeria bacterium]HCG49467.1 hypothetical protein [Lentisphaeria bacterium]